MLEVDKAITFMASLPITDKKLTKLNFLPYDTLKRRGRI